MHAQLFAQLSPPPLLLRSGRRTQRVIRAISPATAIVDTQSERRQRGRSRHAAFAADVASAATPPPAAPRAKVTEDMVRPLLSRRRLQSPSHVMNNTPFTTPPCRQPLRKGVDCPRYLMRSRHCPDATHAAIRAYIAIIEKNIHDVAECCKVISLMMFTRQEAVVRGATRYRFFTSRQRAGLSGVTSSRHAVAKTEP